MILFLISLIGTAATAIIIKAIRYGLAILSMPTIVTSSPINALTLSFLLPLTNKIYSDDNIWSKAKKFMIIVWSMSIISFSLQSLRASLTVKANVNVAKTRY